jgi:hypothetical protein
LQSMSDDKHCLFFELLSHELLNLLLGDEVDVGSCLVKDNDLSLS